MSHLQLATPLPNVANSAAVPGSRLAESSIQSPKPIAQLQVEEPSSHLSATPWKQWDLCWAKVVRRMLLVVH
jgi:hypothetical protein